MGIMLVNRYSFGELLEKDPSKYTREDFQLVSTLQHEMGVELDKMDVESKRILGELKIMADKLQAYVGELKKEAEDWEDINEYHEEVNVGMPAPTIEEIEEQSIRRALLRNQGSRKRAAEDLNMSERTLYRKMEKYGIS